MCYHGNVRHLTIIGGLLACVATLQLYAQVERVLPRRASSSLEGTHFIVGFMANEILQAGGNPRIQIFIASQYDATVKIISPITGIYSVFVPANTVHVETMHVQHVVNASEKIFQRAIFVESDVPVVVYALNTITQSSDSYTAIPIKHCGKLYYTLNRPTDWYRGSRDPLSRVPRVGEFMVMATENNTLVDIVATTTTKGGVPARIPFRVWLNKGDCYLVQALPTRFGGDDLTGSSISSNIPVAVVSGHQRASMPLDSLSSKDHLVEQLPPVNLWGKTYATTPFISSTRPDVLRIMASRADQDIVLITKNGSRTFRINNPGEWADTALLEPAYWTSTKPFFVTQFMTSTQDSNHYTDPAMVVVPAVEQFVNAALFQFPKLEINNSIIGQEFYYFLNIIADSIALATLRVDTSRVARMAPQIITQTVPGTSLHWATLQMQPGAYLMTADTGTFSGVMYGSTLVDSYANMIGVAYVPVPQQDNSPPKFSFLLECGVISGTIADVSNDTARLDEVRVVSNRSYNYRWQWSVPMDSTGTVEFDADIRDLWKDAQIVIQAFDYLGNGREFLFHYDAPNVDVPKESVISLAGQTEVCTTAVLKNEDSTPVHIVRLSISGDVRIRLAPGQTIDTVLAAGDSLIVNICIKPTKDTSAVRGYLVVEYPCKLIRMMTVRGATLASLRSGMIDFGVVRLGDTVCGRVPVINNGSVSVTISAFIVAMIAPDLLVDPTSLLLPRTLAPGDTLWIGVCFSPTSEGQATRSDTAVGTSALTALARYTGRGVKPLVRPIHVDWGRRRLGSINDTAITIRNSGSGWCMIRTSDTVGIDSSFTIRDLTASPLRLDPGSSVAVRLQFLPVVRGLREMVIPLLVDWKGHEPIAITMSGFGTLPEVAVRDIDLGIVTVYFSKDSTADLVTTGAAVGNEDLTVYNVRVFGPDVADFSLPAVLADLRNMPAVDVIRGLITFSPRRLGLHECRVEIVHDAASFGLQSTSIFTVRGMGVEIIEAQLALTNSLNANVQACTLVQSKVTIANTGNGPMRVDSLIYVSADSSWSILTNGLPMWIGGGTVREIDVPLMFDRTSARTFFVRLVDSAGAILTASVTTNVMLPVTDVSIRVSQILPYQTGPVTIHVQARLETRQEDTTYPAFRVLVPRGRFMLSTEVPATATATYVAVNDEPLQITVEQSMREISVRSTEPIRGSWLVDLYLNGSFLWLNPSHFEIRATVEATRCFDPTTTVAGPISVVPCAGAERVITLGTIPTLRARLGAQPVSTSIEVELDASHDMDVTGFLESVGGQRIILPERFSLQKGRRHCIFSCSGWASGLYRLVLVHGAGVADLQIIIVN